MHSPEVDSLRNPEVIALLGAPNSGKTTLFNWMTGSKYKAVNYPGSTVDYYIGSSLSVYGSPVTIMDTPGTYSLFPQSADEEVTWKALFQPKGYQQIQKVIVVVDSMQLHRHLYLAKQAQEAGFDIVIALTMTDLLKKEKLSINSKELSLLFNCPVIEIDGTLGGGVKDLVQKTKDVQVKEKEPRPLEKWDAKKIEFIFKDLDILSKKVFVKKQSHLNVFLKTKKLDQILLHPVFGYLIFVATMLMLFTSIFWMAAPFMDYVDAFFSVIAEKSILLIGENLLSDLIANGIIASFAAVFIFVPQIFILFLGIGFLEDSGYLARASTLIDKPFSKIGMNGRSFVPVLSGFACAVPAIMASRTLGNARERLITMFIIPLMSCSARLPVFALLLTFLFYGQPSWKAGLVLTGIYFSAIIFGAIAAAILNKILKTNNNSMYMMELPIYRAPHLKVLLKNAYLRTSSYVKRAGPIIFLLAFIIWTLTTFPNYKADSDTEKLQSSYAGQIGQTIEPIFEPMGMDWRAGVGLLTAFAAREVFVSSLAVMFNVTDSEDDETMQKTLLSKMSDATNSKGAKIFTPATVTGLIIFFIIALQCISTVAIAAREMNSWKWAMIQLVSFNVVAYALAVIAVQGLRSLGIN